MNDEELVRARLDENRVLAGALTAPELVSAVVQAGRIVVETVRSGGRVFFFGNGGSAADASHLAAEFVGRCTRDRRAVAALALGDATAAVTAIANDYGYDAVFSRQIEALGRPGDLAVGLTTSGRSANVVAGLKSAESLGLRTIALTGASPGAVGSVAERCLSVPSTRTGRVQEVHVLWGHLWAEQVEDAISRGE